MLIGTNIICSKEKDDDPPPPFPRDRPITARNQIGGTHRTRVRREGASRAVNAMIYVVSVMDGSFYAGRSRSHPMCQRANIRYLRGHAKPLRDRSRQGCDVVAPDSCSSVLF